MFPLHILNTRPRSQATELTQRLQALGCVVSEYPLFEIVPTATPNLNRRTHYEVIICTSNNAITHGLPWLTTCTANHYVAAGSATYSALCALGMNPVYQGTPCGSQGMLTAPSLNRPNLGHVLLLTGQDTPPYLANTLRQRGANVTVAATYRRIPNTEPLRLPSTLDFVIVTSKQGLQQLHKQATTNAPELLKTPLVVVTKGIRKLAISYHFSDTIYVTDRVSNEAILDTIYQYMTQLKERL
jgi:uroporphyrinogen-III synthase